MLPESEIKWHVRIQPENSDSVNMLNMIEIGDGDDSRITNAELITSQKRIGVRIGNWLVMFSLKEGMNKSVSYY